MQNYVILVFLEVWQNVHLTIKDSIQSAYVKLQMKIIKTELRTRLNRLVTYSNFLGRRGVRGKEQSQFTSAQGGIEHLRYPWWRGTTTRLKICGALGAYCTRL
jgi:hypothetical protein